MLRLALRSVLARWGRVVLTALAIVAGTAFLSGTFIFRDTVERTFDALYADLYEKVDVYVQSSNTVELAFGFETRDRLAADSVDRSAPCRAWLMRRRSSRTMSWSSTVTASRWSGRRGRPRAARSTTASCPCGRWSRAGGRGRQRGRAGTPDRRRCRVRRGRHRQAQRQRRVRGVHRRRHRRLQRHRLARQRHLGAVRLGHRGGVRRPAGLRRRRAGPWRRLGVGHRAVPAGAVRARPRRGREPDARGDHRPAAGRGRQGAWLRHHLPVDLLVRRAGRRRLRHLQRVLDHHGAAPAGERAACVPFGRAAGR